MNPFKRFFQREQQEKRSRAAMDAFAKKAKDFTDDNPGAFAILCDPETDVIFMAHQGIVAPVRLLDTQGNPVRIVSNALKHSRGDADVDRFLLAVDGGLFAIAKGLYDKRRASLRGKVLAIVSEDKPPTESKVSLTDGSRISPIQLVDGREH